MTNKQYVWIVRYGLTEHPLVENLGPFDSDIDPTEGIQHANAIAARIANTETPAAVPKQVYSSPFLRTVHTAHILADALPQGTTVRIEEGLTEWQVPSLLVEPNGIRTYPKSTAHHATHFHTIDKDYTSQLPSTTLEFPETEEVLLQRCTNTLHKILDQSQQQSIAIVSHAPCDIAIALALHGTTLDQAKGLWQAWPLGGLTLFSRSIDTTNNSEWTLEFYGDSSHMPGDYQAGLKRWTLPALQN